MHYELYQLALDEVPAAAFAASSLSPPRGTVAWPAPLARDEFLPWRHYFEAQLTYRAACGEEIASMVSIELTHAVGQFSKRLKFAGAESPVVARAEKFLHTLITAPEYDQAEYQISH